MNMNAERVVVVGTGCASAWIIRSLLTHGLRVTAIEAEAAPSPRASLFRPTPGSNTSREFAPAVRTRRPVQSSHPFFDEEHSELYTDDLDNPYSTPAGAPYL